MNVLVVGGGGREHALAWKISQGESVEKVYVAPGNPGTGRLPKGENARLDPNDHAAVSAFIRDHNIALTVIGPEAPLCAGIVDTLSSRGHRVFGPVAAAARIEGSKAFAKDFMRRFNIPTADYARFDNFAEAEAHCRKLGAPLVIKADGLAAGKGVTVAHDLHTAIAALRDAMVNRQFGEAGASVVIESCLVGEEASILAFCDGKDFRTLASSQDHKAVYDNDQGPNTGGMGAYSPAPVVTPALQDQIDREILRPFVEGMRTLGTPYVGIIYAGLMITAEGPKVIEFNCRLGDPETQCVLPRMTSDLVEVMNACISGNLADTPLEFDNGACVTVVMASGGYPGDFQKGLPISGIEAAERDNAVTVFHAGTAERDGQLVTSGGRVLTVTARDGSLPAAIERAYAAVDAIHFEGAHFRKDIGKKAFARLAE
ncbi:MAG: hypothetical protein RLZZ303_1654 [Candidatus Hydrogenedentota bacterium]|jgi:phosphoribosylamine--glycine ligase